MVNQNNPSSHDTNAFPAVNEIGNHANAKLNEDQYDIYVNGNFVGQKTLKTQGEKLSDIDECLHNQGLNNFSVSLDGDHYIISTAPKHKKHYQSTLTTDNKLVPAP